MRFADLSVDPRLLRTLEAMGIREARPVQAETIPAAKQGGHVLALAPTGTGKTLAFGVPIAERMLADRPAKGRGALDPRRRLRALVLCPTRELAVQVGEELSRLVKGLVLRVAVATGKSAISPQKAALAEGVDLLVGTPGRIRELLECDAMSLAFLRQVVVDEADRMLDFGFMPQVRWILERTAADPQRMLFSATLPRPVERLAEEFLPGAARIEIGDRNAPAAHLAHRLLDTSDAAKVPLLLSLIAGRRGVLVFARTRRRAGWVAEALRRNGVAVGILHGDRTPAQRRSALEGFLADRVAVLVATDVAARGLHLPGARLVVNYDLPLLAEEWVHRVGRAGHGGGSGESISLRTPEDAPRWRAIEAIAKVSIAPERAAGAAAPAPRPQRPRGAVTQPAKGAALRASAAKPTGKSKEGKDPARRQRSEASAGKGRSKGRGAASRGGQTRRQRAAKVPPRIGLGVVRRERPDAAGEPRA